MNKQLTLGSLFDGSGGFPLGGLLCGVHPVWASEIEPFPIRVTTKRFPWVQHLGDISCVNGAEIPPVDIITFGSPCTDLSIAGRRDGLGGKQSSLFFQAIRIIKEMREATNGTYPRFCVWENVPGAFSSNAGADFQQVLTEIVRIAEPEAPEVPALASWPSGDILLGDGWSVAYRVIDAAAWVPQRRKRIYLVCDFGSERAADILFEREGVSRNFAAGGFPWQGTAGGAAPGIGGTVAFEPGAIGRLRSPRYYDDISCTLRADMGDNQTAVAVENHPTDSRLKFSRDGLVQTLASRMGTGGNNVPMVFGIGSYASEGMKSPNPHAGIYEADSARTLDANGGNPACNQGGMCVVAFAQNQRDEVRDLHDCAGALAAEPGMKQQTYIIEGPAYGIGNGQPNQAIKPEQAATLTCMHDAPAVCIDCRNHRAGSVSGTLQAKGNGGQSLNYINPVVTSYIVRRLTPRECAKLQGFPPDWCAGLATPEPTEEDIAFWAGVFETHRHTMGKSGKPKSRSQIVKWLRDPHTDSAEYKMWGNGVCAAAVVFVMLGIVDITQDVVV